MIRIKSYKNTRLKGSQTRPAYQSWRWKGFNHVASVFPSHRDPCRKHHTMETESSTNPPLDNLKEGLQTGRFVINFGKKNYTIRWLSGSIRQFVPPVQIFHLFQTSPAPSDSDRWRIFHEGESGIASCICLPRPSHIPSFPYWFHIPVCLIRHRQ